MRLKKLILHGFKSFADRTEFVFDAPIVGIVGPNGCGKSNVVDGFRWVLGEQSAKSLRGEAMLDVIFNGSATRQPSGMAEVTLVFENPKRQDGTRLLHLDLDEVSVGRRLFRDGTSEYQLNNQPARLRDIRELFLDTGVGVDAYSVIEQGRVNAMLESNPADRRQIFEEAAGISKYKLKKRESERKLEKVQQNLLRLNDIVEEVDKRLRSVRIQAARARTFQEYATRLNELRLGYSLQEFHNYQQQLAQLSARQEEAQFRLDDASGDLARSQNELADQRDELEHLAQRRQRLEHELLQTRAQIESARQQQQFAAQQLDQIDQQLAACASDRAQAEQKQHKTEQALLAEKQLLQQLTAELHSRQQEIDHRQTVLRDGQLKLNELAQQLDEHKSAALEAMRRLAAVGSRASSLEIERRSMRQQQNRLEERRLSLQQQTDALRARESALRIQLEAIESEIETQQQQLADKRSQASQLDQQIAQTGERLAAAREHRSGLISREKLLKDLEARREGISEGVKAVLRQQAERYPFIRGVVADFIHVDVEHARVIEAALDGRDQWLVAAESEAVLRAVDSFQELAGRVHILCTDELNGGVIQYDPVDRAQRRVAMDLVRFDPQDRPLVEHLLGRTLVMDDLLAAASLRAAAPEGFRYVTLAGEVLEPDGTVKAGPLTAAMGLLSRRSELTAIAAQITDVDARIDQLAREYADGNAHAKSLEDELNALRGQIYNSNTLKVELTSQIAQITDQISSLSRERPIVDRELQVLLDQTLKLQAEESLLDRERESLQLQQQSHQEKIATITAGHATLSEELQRCSEQLTASRVALGQVQEKQLACSQQVERYAAQGAELREQMQRLSRNAAEIAQRRRAVEADLASAKRTQEASQSVQQQLSADLDAANLKLSEVQSCVRELSGQVERIRGQHAEAERTLHDVQMKLSELRVRIETLVHRTREELQLDLPARYAEGYQPTDMDWESVAEQIGQLREKIHRLGNVNLDAIGEQDELEQRQQFLSMQVSDLTTSKQQLEELIDTINRESSIRFEQTFNAVREHFQGMFRKLFGGGKADVYLETELQEAAKPQTEGSDPALEAAPKKVDILEAGIEIVARPPGKQPATISQLSGGEKTMTCIALLMSIFKSKPSPFCLLDEVDAALDEANNQRFNLIVQEFLDQSQFIIITHSKITMQIADVLYGVTMQEQGVSKRVAVKFDQIDSQGRIVEHAAA